MTLQPKLLCVSVNPAIDRRITLANFRLGEVNRAHRVEPAAGGKAAHVAYAGAALGADVRWMAFVGGPDGESCRAGVERVGISPILVKIAGRTRTNLELIDELSGQITEVLEPGPEILESEKQAFLRQFENEITGRPTVILSGSLPKGLPVSFYATLVKAAKHAGCHVFLDASGEALAQALISQPDLIKPNLQEASALLGVPVDAVEAATALQMRGPKTVVLSLGAEGAVMVAESLVLRGFAPVVKAISTVGSGDSFLAGWAFAAAEERDFAGCLRLAIACGTANCLAKCPGMIEKEAVQTLFSQVKIEQIRTKSL